MVRRLFNDDATNSEVIQIQRVDRKQGIDNFKIMSSHLSEWIEGRKKTVQTTGLTSQDSKRIPPGYKHIAFLIGLTAVNYFNLNWLFENLGKLGT